MTMSISNILKKTLFAVTRVDPTTLTFNKIVTLASLLLLYGCNTNERVKNAEALSAEIKSTKIKRITDAELTEALRAEGEKIAAEASASLEEKLTLGNNCDAASLISPIRLRAGTEIEFLFAKDTSNTRLFSKESDLLKAYAYQARIGAALEDNLQRINDTLTIYYAPADSSAAIFKKCTEAADSPFMLLRIILNQKEVIQSIDK